MTASPLILLAPSEDKATGGTLGRLPESPAQRWVRERLMVLAQTGSPEALRKAFDVKDLALDRARSEALALKGRVPLLPALARYTGVAFQALDAGSLPAEAWTRVFILSNLRGLVRGDEPVPPYKLKLGALPGLKAHWRKALPAVLAAIPEGPVWELLPGDASDLLKGWSRPRHTVEIFDAQGRAVSHFSKKYRGLVARWLLTHAQGEPRHLLRARIPGCQWAGAAEHDHGGMALRLVVGP
ncbi:MAG: peroxide stress protein YaaA [Holophagaceae bacterium]|uniref:Peroxide stress protein YaaA n=1 Tax=Candidatus Geothrix skivensis TaxID=2954439 RepID=A0A9D7SE02_9BACT|nr:peroxide stress protein YaaA [Candidatus Geothrix skivensis]